MDIRSTFQVGEDVVTTDCTTGHVVADMGNPRGTLLQGQQRVETGHPVGLGRWHRQPLTYVVESSFAYPPDPILYGVKGRQQHVTVLERPAVTSERDAEVVGLQRATFPGRAGRSEQVIDRLPLNRSRYCGHETQVDGILLGRCLKRWEQRPVFL